MKYLIGLIVLALVVAYYYLIYKPSKSIPPVLLPDGTPCSSTGGNINDGVYQNGICKPKNTLTTVSQSEQPFLSGSNIYLNPSAPFAGNNNGLPIYNYPKSDAPGTYIVGTTRPDWIAGQPVGKFIEKAGNTGFTKVKVSNLQIWKFMNGYTTVVDKITGDYYFRTPDLQKTPY